MAVVDTAEVEIRPDFDPFRDAQQDIEDSFREMAREVDRIFERLESDINDTAEDMGREFQTNGEQAERALDEVGDKGEREFDRIEREARDASDGMGSQFRRAAGALAAAFAVVQIGQFFSDAALEAQKLNSAMAATDQIIESTGGAAGLLTEEVRGLSRELSLKIGVDSVEVQEAANVLLTFRNVGEDTFDQTLGLAADLSAVLGTDLNSATLQLGKALNDPATGMTALTRSGITFTEEQKEMIRTMQEAGDIAGAQGVILEELENQVSGVAEASADSTAKIGVAFTELQRALGESLIAAVDEIAPAIIGVLESLEPALAALGEVFGGLLTAAVPVLEIIGQAFAQALRALIPAIEPVGRAVLALVEAFAPMLPLIATLIATLLPPLAQIIGAVATAMTPLINLFVQFITSVLQALQPILQPIVAIFTEIASTLGEALFGALSQILPLWLELIEALLPIIPALLQIVEALLPLLPALLELVTALLPVLIELLELLAPVIVIAAEVISELVSVVVSGLSTAISAVIGFVTGAINRFGSLRSFVGNVVGNVRGALRNLAGFFGSIGNTIANRVGRIRDRVVNGFNRVVRFIRGLPGKVASAARGLFDGLGAAFRSAINGIIAGWNNLRFQTGQINTPVGSIGPFTLDTPNVPYLQQGGMTLGEGLANLHPNEAVLPLDDNRTVTALAGALEQAILRTGGLAGAGDAIQRIVLEARSDGTPVGNFLAALLIEYIRVRGGNVQEVLGQGRAR